MKLKRSMVKSHEKFVTASYPQLMLRGTVINIGGTIAAYLTGLVLWQVHKKLFPQPVSITAEDSKFEN